MKKHKLSLSAFLLMLALPASAQYIQVDNTYSAQQLVDALTANSCAQISNVSVNGNNGVLASYGYFSKGSSDFAFNGGIVLSSGFAKSAEGPNNVDLSDGAATWLGDADLETAINTSNTFNATVLEFDFIPSTGNIAFDYIFASEEYLQNPGDPSWCNYSDGFAFLIKEAGSAEAYRNLAVIPDTDIPVKVTSVRGQGYCAAANEQYFNGYNTYDSAINFNGQTVVLTARSVVTPGTTYHIKLVIADQGDQQYDSAIFLGEGSFTSLTDLGADRLIANNNPLCNGETLTLDATTNGATSYQWYKNDVAIAGATNAQYTVTDGGNYKAIIGLSGGACNGQGKITLDYAPAINTAPFTYTQCDNDTDGLTGFNLNSISTAITNNDTSVTILSFHRSLQEANDNANPIDTTALFYNTTAAQTIYVRVQNTYGCIANTPVVLNTPASVTTVVAPIGLCDDDGTDDGFTAFNLNEIGIDILTDYPSVTTIAFYSSFSEALLGTTPIDGPTNNSFTNTIAGGQNLFARLDNSTGCAAILTVPLEVYYFGSAIHTETASLCDNSPIDLTAPNGFAYSWHTIPVQASQFITVTQPGTYTVTLTNAQGCEAEKTFIVTQSGVPTNVTYNVSDFRGSNNSLTISAGGLGTYEYSLDGINWQASPVFDRLETGEYTFRVRDINGCTPVYSKSLYILDYSPYFSPNADGTMDLWRIPYLNTRPQINVDIFDRYGKFITNINARANGWDGTLNGRPLPADDYWFVVQLENGEQVKGHFSLIR